VLNLEAYLLASDLLCSLHKIIEDTIKLEAEVQKYIAEKITFKKAIESSILSLQMMIDIIAFKDEANSEELLINVL